MSKVIEQKQEKSIIARIGLVPKKYAITHAFVQALAVDIVQHAQDYGNCGPALTLARAIPINQARSLILWFMEVSPIGILLSNSKKTKDKVRFIKEGSPARNEFNMDKAKTLDWFSMDKEAAEKEAASVGSGELLLAIQKMLKVAITNTGKAKTYSQEAVEMATQLQSVLNDFRVNQLQAKRAASPFVTPLTKEESAALLAPNLSSGVPVSIAA
jgi:hypothetical protein